MPRDVKIEHVLKLGDLIGTGPLKTKVYKGTYGVSSKIFESSKNTTKRKPKEVLIKVIKSKILSNSIDWETLQTLTHPNISTYIVVQEAGLFDPVTYVVQDQYLNTLVEFAERTGDMMASSVKRAVKDISSGLQYLHRNNPTPIIHKNLKPSNVLVKCPLLNPSGFVLTDFWYSEQTGIPPTTSMRDLSCKNHGMDCHDIVCWMAPELVANKQAQPTPMMDTFSFGLTLKYLLSSSDELPFDELEEILFQQLVEEMIEEDPSYRITCDGIENHPLLAINPSGNASENVEARIGYIEKSYDEIVTMDEDKNRNVSEQVEKVTHLLASEVFPWGGENIEDSFSRRIYLQMNLCAEKPYNPDSFMDLLRLVKDSKELLIPGELEFDRLRQEIAEDALSKSFPFIIPLIYISMSTLESVKEQTSKDKYKSHRYSIASVHYPSIERKNKRNRAMIHE